MTMGILIELVDTQLVYENDMDVHKWLSCYLMRLMDQNT